MPTIISHLHIKCLLEVRAYIKAFFVVVVVVVNKFI